MYNNTEGILVIIEPKEKATKNFESMRTMAMVGRVGGAEKLAFLDKDPLAVLHMSTYFIPLVHPTSNFLLLAINWMDTID